MGNAPERQPLTERYVESQRCGLCGNIVGSKMKKLLPIGVGRLGTMQYVHKTCMGIFKAKAENARMERKRDYGTVATGVEVPAGGEAQRG